MDDPRINAYFPSSFKGKPVSEIQISELVGLETYKALFHYWPELYYEINHPMIPQKPFTDMIQNIIVSLKDYTTDQIGIYLKKDLIRMAVQGPDRTGIGGSLVGLSPVIRYFNSSPKSKAVDLIMAFVWITVTIWVFYIIGVAEFIFSPVPIKVGFNIFK